MTMTQAAAAPGLSRPIAVDTIPEEGLAVVFEATPAEREALRALNGLVGINALRAALRIEREGRDGLHVTGEVTGSLVQTCVVTLEPFEAPLSEPVSVHFLQPAALERWRADHAADPEDPDAEAPEEPDPIEHNRIDVGALAAEHLTLGLDPYPKKPGARFEDIAPATPDGGTSPFAALKALRPDGA
jgi:hypothetical protein